METSHLANGVIYKDTMTLCDEQNSLTYNIFYII